MNTLSADYGLLEESFIAWLHTRSDIVAALIVGSRARTHPPADQWSDLDFILFVDDLSAYAADASWLNQFGAVEIAALEHSPRGDVEWIAVFEDGRKLDVLFAPAVPEIDLSPYHVVIQRGARVAIDRSGQLAGAIQSVPPGSFERPTAAEFSAAIQQAWLAALRAVKFNRRGDLWRAKQACDCELKQYLLTFMEWQAQTKNVDTWHAGRYLPEWADRSVVEALPAAFAVYDRSDIYRALHVSIDLLNRIAAELAARWNFDYPAATAARVAKWLG